MKPKHPRTKPNQQIVEEAVSWFVDFRADDVDAHAREEFQRWLRRSPEHIQAYIDIASTYAEMPAPGADGKVDVGWLLAKAHCASDANVIPFAHREVSAASARAPRVARSRLRAALAATVLLALACFSTWYYVERGTYRTDIGEQRSLTLADGSTVQLNSDSRIRVRYTDHARHIELLKGQALFQVAKDAAHPFIVKTDRTQVRAVGTQFDVYRKPSGTVVTVVEGRVAVAAEVLNRPLRDSWDQGAVPGSAAPEQEEVARGHPAPSFLKEGELLVTAGEQLRVKLKSVERPSRPNVIAATAWTSHQLIFDATPLREVAEEFNRYTTRRLVVEGSGLEDFHVSGTYSSSNPDSLLRFLRAQPGINLKESDHEISVTAQ